MSTSVVYERVNKAEQLKPYPREQNTRRRA